MSVLFARLPGSEGSETWYLANSTGDVSSIDPREVETVNADRVVLLVPGTDVFLSEVTAATRSLNDFRAAALFQLEDDLSQPIAELHLALSSPSADAPGTRRTAIVSSRAMQRWMDQLSDLPEAIRSRAEFIPETSLFTSGEPFVFDGDDRLIVFDGAKSFSCDPHLGSEIVPALLQQADLTEVKDFAAPGHVLARGGTSIPSFADFIADDLLAGKGLDLRQGEFARKSNVGFRLSGWTMTLGLAAAAFIFWISTLVVSTIGLDRATDDLYQSMVTAYARAFPDQGRVVDPSREVALRLRNAPSSGGASFVELSAALYSGLSEVEGVTLQGLTFDETSGQITASLLFSGYEDRDLLQQTFDARGIGLQLGGARQEGGVIVGEARLGGQP